MLNSKNRLFLVAALMILVGRTFTSSQSNNFAVTHTDNSISGKFFAPIRSTALDILPCSPETFDRTMESITILSLTAYVRHAVLHGDKNNGLIPLVTASGLLAADKLAAGQTRSGKIYTAFAIFAAAAKIGSL